MVQTTAAQAATQAETKGGIMTARRLFARIHWYLFILLAVVALLQDALR